MAALAPVRFVSGPVSACIFQRGDATVCIFGDYHFSQSRTCDPCKREDGCVPLIDLIEEQAATATASRPLDVFLELPFVPPGTQSRAAALHRAAEYLFSNPAKNPKKHVDDHLPTLLRILLRHFDYVYNDHHVRYAGLLGDMFSRFKGRLYAHGRQGPVRFHYTDIRRERHAVEMFAPSWLIRHVPTADRMVRLVEAFLFDRDFARGVDRAAGFAIERNGKTTMHKIAKQFHRLPDAASKRAVKAYATDVLTIARQELEFYDAFRASLPSMTNKRRIRNNLDRLLTIVTFILHPLLMDIYLICRLLRYQNQRTQGIAIVFAGDAHARAYRRILKHYMGWRPTVDRPATNRRVGHRCIPIRQ